jgi:hypothetical protein
MHDRVSVPRPLRVFSAECVEGELPEVRLRIILSSEVGLPLYGVLRSSFGGGFFPASQHIKADALFENAVDPCGMLRCSLANAQKALGDGEVLS